MQITRNVRVEHRAKERRVALILKSKDPIKHVDSRSGHIDYETTRSLSVEQALQLYAFLGTVLHDELENEDSGSN